MITALKDKLRPFCSRPSVLVLAVFLLGTIVFLPTLNYDFVWDDYILIKGDSPIKSIKNWPLFFSKPFTVDQQSSILYRPLVFFSLSLDYTLFREHSGGYHLTNSILHGMNSALVAYLAWLFFQNLYGVLIAGAFFSLHPVHPEAVAWVSGRADLLLTFFGLLSLIFLVKKNLKPPASGISCLAPFFFFLALLSKETAMIILIPIALLLYLHPQAFKKGRKEIQKFLPFLLMLGLYFILRYMVFKLPIKKLDFNFYYSPLMLFELFPHYMSFLIFPPQRASYLYNAPRSPYPLDFKFGVMITLTLLLVATITYILYRRRETSPLLALIILPCLPSLFFNIGVNVIMIDRYLYLPTAGLALLVTWGFLQLPDKAKKRVVGGLGLVLILYLGGTLWRMPLWKNNILLFEGLKNEYPASPYVRANLGSAYKNQNRLLEAYQELSMAVNLDPQDPSHHAALGWLYLQMGWTQKARQEFATALIREPDHATALEGMGVILMQEGDYDKALYYLDKAYFVNPRKESISKNRELALSLKQKNFTPKP